MITNIHGALQAIGYSLLVLFFVVGVMKTCGGFAEIKRHEIALKMFIRFVLAKASIDYGLELMTSLFEIVQGIVSKIMETSGLSSTTETVLPESIIKAIEESGFWKSVPLWAVTLIGSLFITVLSFIMIMTVYGRFFKIYLYTAIASGIKSIGAIIAAGGIPAVVVIIIICLVGAIGGTCFGILLANDETTGTEKTMSQAISELTSEYYANITAMKATYSYDLLEVKGDTSIKWKDILAIYAIKITPGEDPLEVVALNEVKINLLREIMKEMNKISGVVTPKLIAEIKVTTDDNGNSVKQTVYVTKKVLNISIIRLDANQMALKYKFNDEQNKMLDEFMGEEYDDLWNKLIGDSVKSYPSGGSLVGTGIFAWPLTVDGTITSYFGTRSDPITGEISTHGGTDIAAPQCTPILAAADGTVVAATWHNGYGYYVKIKHNNTYSTLYGHCSELHVSTGQKVKQGQLIAKVGSTGYSTGPHLHYEVIQNGVRVDALRYYK